MATLSEYQKYILKVVAYFIALLFTDAIPHELGHLFIAKLLGFQVTAIHWGLFDSSFVSVGVVFDPVLLNWCLFLVDGV
jgi:membrane-associated protease RseP (regulator of RpoE activity)